MYISSISIEWESISPDTYSDYCTTVIIPTVAKPTFSQASGEVVDGTVVTMSCTTEGATIYYSTDNGDTWTEGNTYTVHENVTLKAKAVNGSDESQVVEATYTVQYILTVDMEHVEYYLFNYHDGTYDNFLVDAEGRPLVHAGENVRVSVAAVEDCYTLQGLSVTFGGNTMVPEYLEDEEYSFIMPASSATLSASVNPSEEYTLTVAGLEYASFESLLVGLGSEEVTLDNNQATICEQLHVVMSGLTAEYGHVLESVTLTYGGQTTEITPESGVYEFTMPSSNATLTITTYEVALFTYTKVTSVTPGKHYIIVTASDDSHGKYHAMGGNNSTGSNPYMNPVEVNVDNNTVTVAENEGVAEILIGVTGSKYTLHTSEGYLAGGDKKLDINGTVESTWGISFDDDQAIITWTINTTGYSIQYNSANPRFACYSSSQAKVCLYEKNEYDLSINGYTDVTEGTNNGGYYLIASPVNVNPATVAGMTTGDFDLYYFDQAEEDEWRNYEATAFNLVPGTGYLYAKKATTENETFDFTLTGIPYAGNGTIDLDYDADAEFPGFNLIGNPFGTNANLDLPYYRLNSDGSALNTLTESTAVNVMEGVFVEATSTIRTATFSPAAKRVSQLNVKVTRNRSAVLDNAIIRFDNGAVLGKFQLNPNSTKLYITEGNQDFAVVRSNNEGEMPVSFKAETRGTYTLSFETEGVEMNYLHLFDNKTGNDVDLLANPSYTFEANTGDNVNRFRLVFKANADVEENAATETFAYFNGSEWVINNPSTGSGDNATLQVIDMMGRVLSSETLNGNANVNINQAAGIYMLRLVNGENVMVQKVVVR